MITSATGAADLGKYYALGQDNYYKTIRENGFETFGSGRETYGLQNGIKEDHFHSLAGRTWNKDLQRWEGGREVAAKDLTVEMPKSLSLLYEMTDDPALRDKIREAIEEANKDMLRTVEGSGIFRVKVHHSDGTFSYHQAENMVVGIVPMHNTSRAQDPHLHVHNLFANSATIKGDTSGKEYAVDFSEIKRNHKFLDSVFHQSLAARLQDLGVNLEMCEKGKHFRVVGISEEQEREFSQRQVQINENLWQKGIDPKTATPAQRDVAWRETRAWKTDVAEETLRAKWAETAQGVGLDLTKAYTPPVTLSDNVDLKDLPPAPTFKIKVRGEFGQLEEQQVLISEAKIHAVKAALDDCAERMGVFKRRDVYRAAVEIAKEQGHALTLRDFKAFYTTPAEKLEVVAIGTKCALDSSFIGEKLTTQKFLDAEKSFLENIKELAETPSERPLVENAQHKIDDWNQDNKRAKGWELKTEQAEMVKALCGQESIVWVQGRAGAGKTTALQAAADIVGRENLFGLAFQGKAAQVLQDETGIESSTIHRFLGQVAAGDKDFLDRLRGGVLVIDEVGMVGTIHAAQLTAVANQYGMRVWGVGDTDQYQSVSAGSPMHEAIVRGHGEMVELAEVTRQANPEDCKMVSDIAQHHAVAAAVKHLSGKDAVHEIFNREQRHAAMINKFADLYAAGEGFSQIITPENSDRTRLNALAHDRLRNDGVLTGQEYEFKNFIDGDNNLIGSRKICVGEKILFTKNSNEKRHKINVKNGEVGVVTGLDHNGLRVVIGDLDKGGREIVVDINKYRHLDQAWAITGHKSQGITEKNVIVEARGKLISLNSFYVMVSRFKQKCHLYTDDKFKLVRAAQAKQSKMSALGIQEDMAARITGHAYADAIANAFISREERDAQTRHKIGQALGEAKEAWWHLAPKDLRDPCNKEFDSSLKKFAMDLAAAKSGSGIENDAVTQRLTKAYEVWLERHETLKKNYKVEVSKLKEKAKGKNVDSKIDALSRRYRGQHAKNDARLLGVASEYNPELSAQLEIKRAIEMHAMDEDSTTLAEKQGRVRGEVVDPIPVLRPQAEAVRQAVVIHTDASEKIRKAMSTSAQKQERRGRDGLSARQKERFGKQHKAADEALAARIAEATGEGMGTATFRHELESEAKRHAKAMREIKTMKTDDAKKAGVKIRDLRREEMARHHGALDGAVVAHESRSEATREVRDLELAHRERMRDLATSRSEVEKEAKAEGRELTPEETKRFSALRNIEEKRFRGELAVVAEKHGLTPEYAHDVREHYRQQGKEVHELRQADAGRDVIEAKRGESDKMLADLEAADRQRPKILSEIRAAQRELAEERKDLGQAKAEEVERLNALGIKPEAEFHKKWREEYAKADARFTGEVERIIAKHASDDPQAAQAIRDTMSAKVEDDQAVRKEAGELARAHGNDYYRAPEEAKAAIVEKYRQNEARRDERLVEIERSMSTRREAVAAGQPAPEHSFAEIAPASVLEERAKPQIVRDIHGAIEERDQVRKELGREKRADAERMESEGKALTSEWHKEWAGRYASADTAFTRRIDEVVSRYAGDDPQAAKEIRAALDDQREQDKAVRQEAGELARQHGNDFYKAPKEAQDKIVARYRENEQQRDERLAAAERGIVERRQAAPSPAPSMPTAKPEAGPEFSHSFGSQAEPAAKADRPAEGLTPDHRPAEQAQAEYRPPVRPRPVEPEQAQAQAPQAEHQAQHSPSPLQPEPPKAEQSAPMERQAEHGQAKPQARPEPERPKVAPILEPAQHSPSPTMTTARPEPGQKQETGPNFSRGGEPPANLVTADQARGWWDGERSKDSGPPIKPQEAVSRPETVLGKGDVVQGPQNATQAPQAVKPVVMDLPPAPDWSARYAEASAKAERDQAVAKLAAGPEPAPAKPAEDPVAKAQAEAKALEAAQVEARERETARMKERAKQDSEKYGPRVAAASEEIIRGTVVACEIKGGRLNAVVDCGNGRYRIAALPLQTNVNVGQTGEFRQQKNNVYSFTPGNLQNMQAVKRFDAKKNTLMPILKEAIQDLSQKLTLGKKMHLGR